MAIRASKPTTMTRLTATAPALNHTQGMPLPIQLVSLFGLSMFFHLCSFHFALHFLQRPILPPQPLTHGLGQGVKEKGKQEQHQRRQEQHTIMSAVDFRL